MLDYKHYTDPCWHTVARYMILLQKISSMSSLNWTHFFQIITSLPHCQALCLGSESRQGSSKKQNPTYPKPDPDLMKTVSDIFKTFTERLDLTRFNSCHANSGVFYYTSWSCYNHDQNWFNKLAQSQILSSYEMRSWHHGAAAVRAFCYVILICCLSWHQHEVMNNDAIIMVKVSNVMFITFKNIYSPLTQVYWLKFRVSAWTLTGNSCHCQINKMSTFFSSISDFFESSRLSKYKET